MFVRSAAGLSLVAYYCFVVGACQRPSVLLMILSARLIASAMADSTAGDGSAIPLRQLTGREDAGSYQQNPFAPLVHREPRIAYSPVVRCCNPAASLFHFQNKRTNL